MLYDVELDWLEHSVGVLPLRDRAIISVSGDDAHDWLQGQLTNRFEGLDPGDSVYAFVLTLKGRILADVFALVRDTEVWLDVPAAQTDALLERLDRYIIMEDVDLERHDDLRVITAQGPRAGDIAEGGWPADRLGAGGRQWIVSDADLDSELERLTARGRSLDGGPIGEAAWADAHVIFGRPRFGVDFGDWTYPQETGLNPIAVSFKKGCYIGQETVVMLENRGKAPKVLWRWKIDRGLPPEPETPIRLSDEVVGEVTSSAQAKEGVFALGFLKRGFEAQGPDGFQVGDASARALGPVQEGPGIRPPGP
ncbi:MAG: hypothetical protein WCE62_03910 [Polyangiales bacterium]